MFKWLKAHRPRPPSVSTTIELWLLAIVTWLIYKSVGWINQSYALAWAGFTQIAQDLSGKAITAILGSVITIAGASIPKFLSANNTWPDKPSKTEVTTDIKTEVKTDVKKDAN
jgi:hypothetical protein